MIAEVTVTRNKSSMCVLSRTSALWSLYTLTHTRHDGVWKLIKHKRQEYLSTMESLLSSVEKQKGKEKGKTSPAAPVCITVKCKQCCLAVKTCWSQQIAHEKDHILITQHLVGYNYLLISTVMIHK